MIKRQMQASLPFSHFLLALAVVSIWGTNFVIIKYALADLPPLHGEAGDNEPSEAESDPAIDTAEDGEQLEWK